MTSLRLRVAPSRGFRVRIPRCRPGGTRKGWAATAATTKVEDGIDTFIFSDGLIRVQTVRYTLQHTS
jgi:hypothetical protein